MATIGFRQFAILLFGVSMIAIGFVGYTGALSLRSLFTGGAFVIVALLSFLVGRTYSVPGRA